MKLLIFLGCFFCIVFVYYYLCTRIVGISLLQWSEEVKEVSAYKT